MQTLPQAQTTGDPSTSLPGEMPVPAPSGCVQLAVAVEVWEVKQPRWQRCEPRARQPPEPLAGPATVLTLGGEISRRDGAEGKVSAPVMKQPGTRASPWCSAPSTVTPPHRGLRLLQWDSDGHPCLGAMPAGKGGTSLAVVDGEMLPMGVAAWPGWERGQERGRSWAEPLCSPRAAAPAAPAYFV